MTGGCEKASHQGAKARRFVQIDDRPDTSLRLTSSKANAAQDFAYLLYDITFFSRGQVFLRLAGLDGLPHCTLSGSACVSSAVGANQLL